MPFSGLERGRRALLRAVAVFVAVLLTAMAVPASADTVVADGDNTTPVSANNLNLGTVCVNSTASSGALVALRRSANDNADKVFRNGSTVAFTVSGTSTAALAASMGSPDTVALPSDWTSGTNTISKAVGSKVTLTAGSTTGSGTGKVTYRATGVNTAGEPTTRDGTLDVSWTISNTGACAPAPADSTPPSVTVSFASPIFGQNGWFNGKDNHPVAGTVTASDDSGVSSITCTDTLTGLTAHELVGGGTKTASRSLSVAGNGVHGIKCEATDSKNNSGAASGSANTATLKIDASDPVMTKSAKTADGNAYTGAWTNQAVTASFGCTDAPSGVVGTYPISQSIPGEIVNGSLEQGCSDNAGNGTSTTFSPINIDKTNPELNGTIATLKSGTGSDGLPWYNTDVTVKWGATDKPSGVNEATVPADSIVGGEGRNRATGTLSVKDLAGNSGSGSVSGIRIDRTGPTISGAVVNSDGSARTPNTAGWYDSAVKVRFTCADPKLADATDGSGVASCPSDEVLENNGAAQAVTSGTAKDVAGNTTLGATVGGINIDGLAPQTKAEISCTGNNGWCRGQTADVTLSAVDSDLAGVELSGVKEIRYSINGNPWQTATNVSSVKVSVPLAPKSGVANVAFLAVDRAGNIEKEGGVALKYDNIAPTVTHALDPAANASKWNNSDVTVKFSATDDEGGSGVASVTAPVVVTEETAERTIEGKAEDNAGNFGYDKATVKLDKTKPTITAKIVPGTSKLTNGWYNGPVTVEFTCTDPAGTNGSVGSGIASCPKPFMLSSDGADQSVKGTAEDFAGNTSETTSALISIDATKPTVTIEGLTQSTPYTLGTAPVLSCKASDGLSGLAGPCTGTLSGGNANGVGTFTYTAVASDRAGNTETKSVTYKVIYLWEGFLQPINDTAHQTGTNISVFKAGSTVPAKFRLKNASGAVVQAVDAPLWLTPARGSATSAGVDETLYSAPATTTISYQWNSTEQHYQYNWGTAKNQANWYWRIGVQLDDGQVYYVNIGLR